ncbi:MATE family efflux transporter [Caproiciproducens sp. MSJ-32]|uniref:MATE family efflux transporter n=1 Tax=Caproiciproducens sp. MSJ-32 TaxID=2841527 RepID=UPI001C1146C2|nr:MATE family efflux transporter [Caproiciproducens sp. MSJ-32]MBU5454854.1 MATE family efflux transporter [Caproiciproducens sp. MSJ-32]
MTKDMTRGNPIKLILTFSLPLLIGNVFQQFYNMADTIIVGKFLGVNALAAVGSTGALSFLVIGFVIGLTGGFGVLVSQKFGAADEEGVKKAFASSLILSAIMTVIITIISLVTVKPLLILMNTPDNILDDALAYIIVIYAGIAATVFYNILSSVLRALGDSKTPLYFLIISSLLNIILDIVFIRSFGMGPEGAAYATVISQGISAVLCMIYIVKKFPILRLKKGHWKIDPSYAKTQLRIGIPMALQFSITAAGAVILQAALNGFGSIKIAAYTAALKVQQVFMQPSISFGVTMATYAGQNLGAGKIDRIKDGVKKGTIISIIVSITSTIIVLLFGTFFIKMFVSANDVEVIETAKHYLDTVSFFYIPLGLIFIFRNTLQGIGDSFVPMMAGFAETVARTVVAFTLPKFLDFTGIALADPAAWIAAAIPLTLTYIKRIKSMMKEKENKEEEVPALAE